MHQHGKHDFAVVSMKVVPCHKLAYIKDRIAAVMNSSMIMF